MLNAIMTGVSLFNAVKGNKRADAADDRQKRKVVKKPKNRENRVQRDNREYTSPK